MRYFKDKKKKELKGEVSFKGTLLECGTEEKSPTFWIETTMRKWVFEALTNKEADDWLDIIFDEVTLAFFLEKFGLVQALFSSFDVCETL